MDGTYKSLRIEKADGIAELVLTGPGKGNAMGPDFWREMPEALRALDADDAVRVLLVRGEGQNFTYGLDLMGMMESLGPLLTGESNLALERSRLLKLIGEMQQATEGMARCRKPVIAAVHGWCIGGGMDLIAACDFRYCSQEAKFSLREVKVGIVADLGALQRLPRIIGEGNTRELAYTGGDVDAARALRMGLVNEVFPSPEALLTEARATARRIADNPPLVVQGAKQVMEYCADKSIADGLRYVAVWNSAFLQSLDLTEAFSAFAERRPPKFQGR
ncbi:crotonase/enoyl-CoA hydratase family protein [Corallococcus exiguus]|uniref:crotonase/enoyl-CoA hydratase family protein n=1 Tax=Corallococcus TaxID=83461 RepID=UPI000EA4075F|nr:MULTISPECIES: crotonase/enoyl-CoA hydratase family protein [Corallococcus]NNC20220.1 crotonase/enoyl-CoA hydratase family protein [Corallococcus exiguus]NRD64269.1 crotonase/enoyl-CoA hydratase family protein [Corallococcus exiguus]RKH16324.1 crotonase/enoyl-CoA hydratase family protein [Corallococcus sp. CA041A]RKI13443.1 crotonase/enoyl-CoA hydratase family protein [Corallococcus sp. AB030]RUO92861.1 crotonase/enoyl-CoA hydratase family protein [Corallococcus sp. AB018]